MKKILGFSFLFLLASSLPAIFYLLRPGFYEPHDLHHLADIFEVYRGVTSGQIPPRLGPDYLWGWGYPLFNFYYTLPFYLGALFYSITKSLTGAFEFVFVVSASLSILGMYLFLREFLGKAASFAGAILYLYTPYRAVQIYVRGAMGEALTMAILPFAFWAITRVTKTQNKIGIFWLGMITAALILSHNYLWILAAPCLAVYFVLLIRTKITKKDRLKSTAVGLAGFLLGAGISAFWWLPAIVEYRLVSGVTPFLLEDHFPFIKQLILPSWGYGSSVWGSGDGMSFQIGLVNLAAVLMALVILLKRKNLVKNRSIGIFALISFFISVAMMNIRTLPIWRLIPNYVFIQFPWRLLFLTTFFSSLLAAYAISSLRGKFKYWAAVAIGVSSIVLTLGYFKPSKIFFKDDALYLSRMFATAAEGEERTGVSQDYVNWSEDYLLLPDGAKKPEGLVPSKIDGSQEVKILEDRRLSPIRWEAVVEAESSSKVTFFAYAFPGWFAKLDGRVVPTIKAEPYGQIEVVVPAGIHNLEFYWAETRLRATADLVSFGSILIALALLVGKGKKRNVRDF